MPAAHGDRDLSRQSSMAIFSAHLVPFWVIKLVHSGLLIVLIWPWGIFVRHCDTSMTRSPLKATEIAGFLAFVPFTVPVLRHDVPSARYMLSAHPLCCRIRLQSRRHTHRPKDLRGGHSDQLCGRSSRVQREQSNASAYKQPVGSKMKSAGTIDGP